MKLKERYSQGLIHAIVHKHQDIYRTFKHYVCEIKTQVLTPPYINKLCMFNVRLQSHFYIHHVPQLLLSIFTFLLLIHLSYSLLFSTNYE